MVKRLFFINLRALVSGILRIRPKKSSPLKNAALIVLFAFIAASFMTAFGSIFYLLRDPLFSAGIGWLYFSVQALLSFGLSVIGTIFSAQTLFKAKDNEMLLSMPIKPYHILLSRFLVILLFEYVFELLIAIPAFIVWLAGDGCATPAGVVFCLIGYALLPLMSLTVACLVAWILSAFFSRFRHSNIVTLAVAAFLLWVYLRLYSQLQSYINLLIQKGVEIAEAFRRAAPPFYAFGAGIVNHSLSDAAVFYLWALIPFLIMFAIMAVNYTKILTTNRGAAKSVYREKTAKVSGACFALTKKELAHYAAKPMVVLNTSISSMFMLFGIAMMIIRRAEFMNALGQIPAAFGNMPLAVFAAAALMFMGGINNLSAALISLEGKQLWIAKTIPVEPKVIYLSKIYTHLISSALPCFLASVCAALLMSKSVADSLLIIVLPQTYIVLIAVAGLAINLLIPRFDWYSEIQPVKQGAASMIVIFGSMLFVIALLALYIFVLRSFFEPLAFAWVMAAIFAACAFFVWQWLSGAGAERLLDL